MEEPLILFSSADFAVVDKPPGWLSIPSRDPAPGEPVVSHWLGARFPGPVRVVHRLDRYTSGVMIFALNDESHRLANGWFRTRKVKKTYQFIGAPAPSRPAIQVRTPVDGKPAQTLFEVIETRGRNFLGRATPLTGRFHQIRDHAKVAGFPLLGDRAYGGDPAPRVCLHAASLETPIGTFSAPFASDLQAVWEALSS